MNWPWEYELNAALIHSSHIAQQLQKGSNACQFSGFSVKSLLSLKEFANVCITDCIHGTFLKSLPLYASHETLCMQDRGLPQEKWSAGYVRISPSLSCHNEFPSIMFPFYVAGVPSGKCLNIRNKCHCFSLTMVHGDCWAGRPLLYWDYSWSGVVGLTVSLEAFNYSANRFQGSA